MVAPTVDRPWTLQPNLAFGEGDSIYTHQSITINGTCDTQTARQIYNDMKSFKHFSANNISDVRIVHPGGLEPKEWRDRTFAMFRAKPYNELGGVTGALNSAQRIINPAEVPVELFFDDHNMTITAVTLGPHMIVGYRKWHVSEGSGSDECGKQVVVQTEAWERRNGSINDKAMMNGGKDAMIQIWAQYLKNIAKAATGRGGTSGDVSLFQDRIDGGGQPFAPGGPGSGVAGPAVPPGYYNAHPIGSIR
jgi:hypothetical protein